MLHENHPHLFEEAVRYEKDHKDGREYTWTDGETLTELLARKEQIILEHNQALKRKRSLQSNLSLAEALEEVLDQENDELPCLSCHL